MMLSPKSAWLGDLALLIYLLIYIERAPAFPGHDP
jgi:hypothetical protein